MPAPIKFLDDQLTSPLASDHTTHSEKESEAALSGGCFPSLSQWWSTTFKRRKKSESVDDVIQNSPYHIAPQTTKK